MPRAGSAVHKPCTADGCEKHSQTRDGFCPMHHARMMRTGTLDAPSSRRITTCSVGGCSNSGGIVRGMCQLHYKRVKNTGHPFPLVHYYSDGDPAKWCSRCKSYKQVDEFYLDKSNGSGYAALCRECSTKIRTKNSAQDRITAIAKRYSITADQYESMLEAQDGKCANTGCRTDTPGGHGTWHIDHNHACCPPGGSCGECVRGLLCARCNTGLGMFGDSVGKLQGAIEYLKNHEDPHPAREEVGR